MFIAGNISLKDWEPITDVYKRQIIFTVTRSHVTVFPVSECDSISTTFYLDTINNHFGRPAFLPLFRFHVKPIEIIKKFPIPIYCIIR